MISTEHLSGITAFVQAADAGGFTLAAERLGLSKSGIAKSVARLEDRLGVRLFNRTTRRFALTTEGQSFYETCVRVLADLENAEAALNAHRLQPRGRLRVDLPVVFGRRWVLPVLLDIGEHYPELSQEVSLTDRRIDPIDEGIDLVIRIGDLDDSSMLVARRLGVQQSVLCASPDYLDRHGRPTSLDDLGAHACIVFGRSGQSLPWWFLDGKGAPMAKPVSGRLSFNHSDAICDAALAGQGIALLSTWLIADHLRGGRLARVLPAVPTRGFPIHALWPQTRQMSPKVRVVVDELVNRFLPDPPWDPDR
ncbi:LysR family transcriptional regulator [Methylocystis bryophila]|uniref:LysR family transcriptional regulator n=1 Tax=Methylocystis bryophila TaxID=655015 RepID=A0A1W6MZX7_9HYPH|nr:LysR family transcriptional regulator [Methylocystis bryophila]ARN83132.1 LysR family transcriptional regulator [Methylocystis bryophila]BDV39460.1 LysR family transcriptional regulator [Methylocystis bryophila]